MTAFFQHVGEENSARDFPKTLVSESGNALRFNYRQIEKSLPLSKDAHEQLRAACEELAPGGFQIWGVPRGAISVLKQVVPGDVFLLLRTRGAEGRFGYAGRVVAVPRCDAISASTELWGEDRFPLLLFLDGGASELPWHEFRQQLGYAENWDPRGQTYRIVPDRLSGSSYRSEAGLLEAALGPNATVSEVGTNPLLAAAAEEADMRFLAAEGRRQLRQHWAIERNLTLIRKFKASLSHFRCSACDFDFEAAYGILGRGYVEAHHTNPIGGMREGDLTDLATLVALCANCHRMIHRQWPPLSLETLQSALRRSGNV